MRKKIAAITPSRTIGSVTGTRTLTEGRSRSQIMEWMLVTDVVLVARYCEREYIVTAGVAQMFDWMAP